MTDPPTRSWPVEGDGTAGDEHTTSSVNRHDHRGRRLMSVAEFARHLCYPLYADDVDVNALARGCDEAAELGLAAVVCRPAQVGEVARRLEGADVAVVTGLGFGRPSTLALTEEELLAEARPLIAQGASELAVIVNAPRLKAERVDGSPEFVSSLVSLAARQQELGFRMRVHVEGRELGEEKLRDLCGVLASAGVWMVQAGSWEDPNVSYRQLLPMREALGNEPLLKWTTPVRSVRVMLLAMSYGVDRFNAQAVRQFLDEAAQLAEVSPLAVPLAELDY